jgi:polyisoprenoid-binding protein YceI
MASPQPTEATAPALQALRDGKLAGSWTLDAPRSEIGLRTKAMWGLAKVTGVFREASGEGTVSPAGDVTGTITVTATSIDTKNGKRDTHLRSADFFEVEKYPDITVAVQSVESANQGVTVTGTLTVHGQSRPLSLPAIVSGFDGDELSLDGEVQVSRAEFGLTFNQLGSMSMDNTITVHLVFTRKQDKL